jgi:hypothetical protein
VWVDGNLVPVFNFVCDARVTIYYKEIRDQYDCSGSCSTVDPSCPNCSDTSSHDCSTITYTADIYEETEVVQGTCEFA